MGRNGSFRDEKGDGHCLLLLSVLGVVFFFDSVFLVKSHSIPFSNSHSSFQFQANATLYFSLEVLFVASNFFV
jgi:hypothetical protein